VAVFSAPAQGQDCGDLYDPYQVLNFYVTMSSSDWESLRQDCPGGYCGERPHDYYHARFRCEDGPGNGFSYIVRGSGDSCAVGTWDAGSAGQVASRDADVESSSGACP
jgi:hypothetical protein